MKQKIITPNIPNAFRKACGMPLYRKAYDRMAGHVIASSDYSHLVQVV